MKLPFLRFWITFCVLFFSLVSFAQTNCRVIAGDSATNARVYPPMQLVTINYIIPTVVHIYYDSMSAPQLPTFREIDSIINEVNVYLRRENADTSLIATPFRNIIGDAQMELRLARYDTAGNCISGIIYHEVDNISDPVQHELDHQHYFNVHINVPFVPSAAAYATMPQPWNSPMPFGNDGIFFLTIGSFRTDIFLHELGHWLGLQHIWGQGPIGVCGDDLVADTPITTGSYVCDTTLNSCNPGNFENVQNFMDYAYCMHMFTIGQASRMQAVLNDPLANRREISITSNLVATGVLTPPTCGDTAEILVIEFPAYQTGCTVSEIHHFVCNPVTAVPDSVHWIFQGGTPATSSLGVQLVSFATPGYKNISMTAYFNGVPQVHNMIFWAQPSDSLLTGNGMYYFDNYPFTENFENNFALPDGHLRVQAADTTWEIRTGVGYNSDSCLFVRPEYNVGVDTNKIILGTFNLDTLTNPVLTFYVAASDYANAIDRKIMVRGRQWCFNNRTIWLDVIYDTMMTQTNTGTNFIPSSPAQWYKATVNLGGMIYGSVETEISLMLVKDFRQSGVDDNFYLDNISVHDSIVGLPPVADFSISDTLFCFGSCNNYIEFVDRSTNLPDQYNWNMTSNPLLQNAVLLGNYCIPWDSLEVTLIVSNAFGSDTASHWIYTRWMNDLTASADTTTICAGDTVTLSAYGFDPDVTFLWENITGPTTWATLLSQTDSVVQAIPTQQTTMYKLTATNSIGCFGIRYITITRNIYPGSSYTASSYCVGAGTTVTLTGQNCSICTITWSPTNVLDTVAGQIVQAGPLSATTPITVSYNLNGCISMFTDTIVVSTLAVTANATDTLLCTGEAVTLTGSGAAIYAWSNGVTDGLSFTPSATQTYTVTGNDGNGCIDTDTITVVVDLCLDIAAAAHTEIDFYPVPADEVLNISNPGGLQLDVVLTDVSGKVVRSVSGNDAVLQLNTSELAEGIYLLHVNGGQTRKIVVRH